MDLKICIDCYIAPCLNWAWLERSEDAHYFKSVADYIHLNPARSGLAGGDHGKLVAYPLSSLRHYPKVNAPEWQPLDRVLDAFRLNHERRIVRVNGAELGLPETIEERRALRKGDPGKVICAALVKANTSVTNKWLTARLCMGHPAAMCQLVSRSRKYPKIQKILKKHEKSFESKD